MFRIFSFLVKIIFFMIRKLSFPIFLSGALITAYLAVAIVVNHLQQ